MKFARSAVLAACLASLPLSIVQAEPVDMSTITCAQLATMKQDEVTFMLTWVAGYLAGEEGELSMDPDILGETASKMVTYCQENTEMSVLNAAKEVTEE